MFKIESDIPEPTKEGAWYRGYPWYQLEVGQSFFVPDRNVTQMRNAANYPMKKTGYLVFYCQTEKGGCRVWRRANRLQP